MTDEEKVALVLLQARVEPAIARWVDDLADEARLSRSAFLAVVIEEACRDTRWLIEILQKRCDLGVKSVAKKHQDETKPAPKAKRTRRGKGD